MKSLKKNWWNKLISKLLIFEDVAEPIIEKRLNTRIDENGKVIREMK